MTSMNENLPNRVRKLTKPGNAAQALQPFLEAVSNAFMAIDDRREVEENQRVGSVKVEITALGQDDMTIVVRDGGIGLDDARFEAFCTLDTDFKERRGGKGVGRLFWLDAFRSISVSSRYRVGAEISQRDFRFRLSASDQIIDLEPSAEWKIGEIGTQIRFEGLRQGSYLENFSKQIDAFKTYFAAEFIADFLSGGSPQVHLGVETKGGKRDDVVYPEAVAELVAVGPERLDDLQVEDLGTFAVNAYLCDPKASRGLKGKHHVHLLGNRRTVESRKIDDLLGINQLSHEGDSDLALHLVVESDFLDERTSESRTSFTFPEGDLDRIVKAAVAKAREQFIADQVAKFDRVRRISFDEFLKAQPIFAYASADDIFASLPVGTATPEAYARALVVPRMRAEESRERRLKEVVQAVVRGDDVPDDFAQIVRKAADGIHENERNSLAHHAARRRVVLDLLDALIRRIREREDKEDVYHLEKTLHSLLVPMRVVGTDPATAEHSAHDLWILDERLAFAAGFASDVPLKNYVLESESDDRPDIVLWDVLFGLGSISSPGGDEEVDDVEPLSKVFIVELKHPGRKPYSVEERVEDQVRKYVAAIKNGTVEGFGRRNIRVSPDCQFHCTVVADFEGRLKDEVSGWAYTLNKQGRARRLEGDFANVTIEAVEWDYVLRTAREANAALLDAAGLQKARQTNFAAEQNEVEGGPDEVDEPNETSVA